MPESISPKLFAAIPAGDHYDMILQSFPLQYACDNHARAGFTIIVLDRARCLEQSPGIVGRFCEFLLAAELFDKGLGLIVGATSPARDRIFGPAVRDDSVKNLNMDRILPGRTWFYVRISRTPSSPPIRRMSAARCAKMPTVTTPGIRLIRASISSGLDICRSWISRM